MFKHTKGLVVFWTLIVLNLKNYYKKSIEKISQPKNIKKKQENVRLFKRTLHVLNLSNGN